MEKDGNAWLERDWKESGVDMPPLPHRTGQGRELIERALPYQFDTQTTFAMEADGVHCTILLPISDQRPERKPDWERITGDPPPRSSHTW
jgi:hypothetical protein